MRRAATRADTGPERAAESACRRWSRARGLALAVAAAAAVSLTGGRAIAAPRTFVSLQYDALAGCPDAGRFRASVERQLGYDPFRGTSGRRVAVQVTRADGGLDGRIRWTDAAGRPVGERRLSTRRPDCAGLASNLAFAVAVQIQLMGTLAPPAVAAKPPSPPAPPAAAPAPPAAVPPSPPVEVAPPPATAAPPPAPEVSAPVASAPPAAAPAPVPPPQAPAAVEAEPKAEAPVVAAAPTPAAPRAPTSGFGLSLGLGPSLALALAPHVTGLGRLFVAGRIAWFSLELSLDGALPARQTEASGGGFTFDRYAAELAACGHIRGLGACVTGAGGIVEASGFGVDVHRSPLGYFAGAGGRLMATLPLGARFFVTGRVEALVLLSRWTVTLNHIDAWTTPRVGGIMGVDLGARIF